MVFGGTHLCNLEIEANVDDDSEEEAEEEARSHQRLTPGKLNICDDVGKSY